MIELIDIEGELTKLWDQIEGNAKIRAALFNLIVYVPNRALLPYVERITRFVTKKLPCRTLFLLCDGEAKGDYLRTRVSVEMIGTGEQPIACDQIWIEFSKSEAERVPFLVYPHLVPDLPISLLWEGDPTLEPAIFSALQKLASRILFDPDSIEELPSFARFTLELMEEYGGEIADQKWGCLQGWRRVLRQTFRSKENLRHLKRLERVKITSANKPGVQGVYLESWLRAELKISPKIEYVSRPCTEESEGTIVELELFSEGDGHFLFIHDPEGDFVRVHSDSPEKCDLPYTLYLRHLKREESFAKELLRSGVSGHYCDTLRFLAK